MVTQKLKQISPTGGEIALTIAQQFRKEGHIKGIEEGIKQVAINLIKKGFDDEFVSECSNLTIQQVQLLRELVKLDK